MERRDAQRYTLPPLPPICIDGNATPMSELPTWYPTYWTWVVAQTPSPMVKRPSPLFALTTPPALLAGDARSHLDATCHYQIRSATSRRYHAPRRPSPTRSDRRQPRYDRLHPVPVEDPSVAPRPKSGVNQPADIIAQAKPHADDRGRRSIDHAIRAARCSGVNTENSA
jgi:hypothetical protein